MDFKDKVTEISKKAGKVATDTYNTVADKSGKLFEEAKGRLSISEMERDIEKTYETIGFMLYEMYKNGEEVGKDFVKECKKIDKYNKDIAQLNKKILFNKGLRVCKECEEIIPTGATFCPNCGAKQRIVKIKDEKKEEKQKEIVKERVCPECGKIEPPESRFCTKCGHKF